MVYRKRRRPLRRNRRRRVGAHQVRPHVRNSRYGGYFFKSKIPATPIDPVKVCKLRYCAFKEYNATALVPSYNVWKSNGIYDTDSTGVGHQPLYFDQLITLYARWRVLGSKCTFSWVPDSGTNQNPSMMGILLSKSSTDIVSYGNTTHILEDRRIAPKIHNAGAGLINANNRRTVTRYYSAKKFWGRGYADPEFSGDETGDPTSYNTSYFTTFVMAPSTGVDPGIVNCLTTIDFIVLFDHPRLVNQS